MICVEKQPIIDRLNEVINNLDGSKWTKQIKILQFTNIRDYVVTMEEHDIEATRPTAKMVMEMEPIIPFGKITKENFYCGNCKERVKKKDSYCRNCGYQFEKEDDGNVV